MLVYVYRCVNIHEFHGHVSEALGKGKQVQSWFLSAYLPFSLLHFAAHGDDVELHDEYVRFCQHAIVFSNEEGAMGLMRIIVGFVRKFV